MINTDARAQAHTAEQLARKAHAEQTDKAGRPYIEHLERVAGRMDNDGQRAVAWLHDIIEDTTTNVDYLQRAGIDRSIVADVETLTRTSHERYAGYIERLREKGSPRAIAVKLADLADHLEHHPDAIGRDLKRRYRDAQERLKSAPRR